jgi:hypothetical protein
MYNVLNSHNVAEYSEFYLGQLWFNVTSIGNAGCFKNELYNGISDVILWLVLLKGLHIKVFKMLNNG